MWDDMPSLISPSDSASNIMSGFDRDPVTGAPRPRAAYAAGRNYPVYPQQGVQYVPAAPMIAAAPFGYAYQGYNPAPYLVPANVSPQNVPIGLPGSPQLVPVNWLDAYNNTYGGGTPYLQPRDLERSPSNRRKSLAFSSPGNSPYGRMIPLPRLADEDDEEESERTWGARLRSWLTGDSYDPHRQFNQEILVHSCLDRRSGMRWLVSAPPHTIRIRDPPDASESAFDPPLRSCRLVSSLLPWAIEIKSHSQYPYITVLSLLGDIYKALSKSIGLDIYESFPKRFREQLDYSFQERIYSIPDEAAANDAFQRGIKRVDFLLDKRRFAGIVQVKEYMNTFEIKFARVETSGF